MIVKETPLKGCFVIEPTVFMDNRGYFFESFNQKKFEHAISRQINFVQDNQSLSRKGVLRGLHYQTGASAQAKLVRVLFGKVLDVVVDLRSASNTYGKHYSIELSDKNQKQLFVPRGFAHGFLVLSEEARFFYKCDNYYDKDAEAGIVFDDPEIGIDWKIERKEPIITEKDISLPLLKNASLIFN